MSRWFGGSTAAVVLVGGAIALAGCGGSSNHSSAYSGSTPGTAPPGQLTRATWQAALQSYNSASAPWIAAVKSFDANTIGAAAPKQVTVLQSLIAQASALKASSAAAGAAQQKVVSLLKQQVVLVQQAGKQVSANGINSALPVFRKLTAIEAQSNAATMAICCANGTPLAGT